MLLKFICKIGSGGTAPQMQEEYAADGVTFIKASNLDSIIENQNENKACKITKESVQRHKYKQYPQGTILFAKSGLSCTKNRVYVTKDSSYIVNHLCALVVTSPQIDSEWLALFIKHYNVTKLIKDESYPSISLQSIGMIDVPTVSLKKQIEISTAIQKIKDGIEEKKKQLDQLDLLIKSRFMEMQKFATSKEKIGVFFEEITKGPFGSDMKKSLYVPRDATTWKVYIQANVIEGDPSVGNYWISDDYFQKKCSRYEVKPEDILITCDGTLGKIYVLPENIERGVISSSLLKIRLKKDFLPLYFKYIWELEMLDEAISQVNNSALKHLPSAKAISKMTVPVLPLVCQQEFVNFLHQVDKSKFVVHSKYFL
jgi:type I restriction enzyme S subunit